MRKRLDSVATQDSTRVEDDQACEDLLAARALDGDVDALMTWREMLDRSTTKSSGGAEVTC